VAKESGIPWRIAVPRTEIVTRKYLRSGLAELEFSETRR
jgi:hypothetical protein